MWLPPDFPVAEYERIASYLASARVLVPSFIPAPAGLLSLPDLLIEAELGNVKTQILPDRNLFTRLVKVARDGHVGRRDHPMKAALSLMAVAQIAGLEIEPSIASHEFAHGGRNREANFELGFFRMADFGDVPRWIDLALGRRDDFVPLRRAVPSTAFDLAAPLRRWRRNYIATLKIAELELTEGLRPIDKITRLLDWMEADFLIASPAAVFAAMYFGSNTQKAGALKGLRSKDRTRAIEGIRNAAWDITHISDFVTRSEAHRDEGRRYLFATADRALHEVASMVIGMSATLSDGASLENDLSSWWPRKQAATIGQSLTDKVKLASMVRSEARVAFTAEQIDKMTLAGEAKILDHQPRT